MAGPMKVMKKMHFKKKSTLDSIPPELISEIVARAAASSSENLFNARSSCKILKNVADDDYAIKRVSLNKFPAVQWKPNKKLKTFLNRCTRSGNLEALYRRGVIQYFAKMEISAGLECLSKAANSGNFEAKYAICVIQILHGGEDQQKGMKMIVDLARKLKNKGKTLKEIRQKFCSILQSIWTKNVSVDGQIRPTCCTRHTHEGLGWAKFEDAEVECEECMGDQELVYLWKVLPKSI